MKRGKVNAQVTIFVIVSILVVSGIGVSVYSYNKKLNSDFFNSPEIKPELDNVQGIVVSCSQEVSKEALELIGFQGGYYERPENYFQYEEIFVPYYYDKGDFNIPLKKDIENELSKYIEDNLLKCVENIASSFDVYFGEVNADVKIKDKEVIFNINFPVKIEKEDKSIVFELKRHPISINSKLNGIYEIADFIIKEHKDDIFICMTCISDMAQEKEVYVEMFSFDDNSTLFVIFDNRTESSDIYSYEFLTRYTGEELNDLKTEMPFLPDVPFV